MSAAEIRISALSKTFFTGDGTQVDAVQNLSLDVSENDFVCIVGPSGCGKSTLLRIVAGLESPTSGEVSFRGHPVTSPRPEIGMVFQEYTLLPWRTVLDNVGLGPEFAGHSKSATREIARKFLRLVGLEQFAGAFPFELSGGMQQRVAIARALANEPKILLMDEPFGALDAHTRILLQRELLNLWEKHRKTILFVTHSVDEAIFLADRIVVMSAHPGVVKEVIPIPLPRPRDRANPLYGRLTVRILEMLEPRSSAA